jgi:hypothetical protein
MNWEGDLRFGDLDLLPYEPLIDPLFEIYLEFLDILGWNVH